MTRPPSDAPAEAPAMPDCAAVMRQLWDYLDGELTPDREAVVRAHLERCSRCYPHVDFERAFLDAVATTRREHSRPEALRAMVQRTLRFAVPLAPGDDVDD